MHFEDCADALMIRTGLAVGFALWPNRLAHRASCAAAIVQRAAAVKPLLPLLTNFTFGSRTVEPSRSLVSRNVAQSSVSHHLNATFVPFLRAAEYSKYRIGGYSRMKIFSDLYRGYFHGNEIWTDPSDV